MSGTAPYYTQAFAPLPIVLVAGMDLSPGDTRPADSVPPRAAANRSKA